MSSSEFIQALLRAQFGLSAGFHFLFVPLSIGLMLYVCLLRTAHCFSGKAFYAQAASFWQRFFVLTWATGIATGYPLRGQLQENWANYTAAASAVLADIFKIEGAVAPWMIGTVLLLAFFSRRLPARVNMLASWFLLGLMSLQALTILAVNAWMQAPTGVKFDQGVWAVTALQDVLLSDTALHKWVHTLSAALLSGTFFVIVVSAVHIRQRNHAAMASVQIACWVGLAAIGVTLLSGHESAALASRTQPMKFAAFEAHWRAAPGMAPIVAWAVPDDANSRNTHAIEIPYLLSLLTPGGTVQSPPGILDLEQRYADHMLAIWPVAASAGAAQGGGMDASLHWSDEAQDRGWLLMRDAVAAQHPQQWALWTPQERVAAVAHAARPAVAPLFWAFRLMVGSGLVCLAVCALAFRHRKALAAGLAPRLMRAVQLALPLPWVAILSGWFVAEVGRQPWTIYGQLPTFHASLHPSLEAGVTHAFGMVLAGAVLAVAYAALVKLIWRAGPAGAPWQVTQVLGKVVAKLLPGSRSSNA